LDLTKVDVVLKRGARIRRSYRASLEERLALGRWIGQSDWQTTAEDDAYFQQGETGIGLESVWIFERSAR
jgi:hypothetical protein